MSIYDFSFFLISWGNSKICWDFGKIASRVFKESTTVGNGRFAAAVCNTLETATEVGGCILPRLSLKIPAPDSATALITAQTVMRKRILPGPPLLVSHLPPHHRSFPRAPLCRCVSKTIPPRHTDPFGKHQATEVTELRCGVASARAVRHSPKTQLELSGYRRFLRRNREKTGNTGLITCNFRG